MGIQLNGFINLYISCGMAPSHIIGASDFAIRKTFIYNPNKDKLSVMNLRSLGPVARQTTVKVKCRIPFSEPIQGSVRGRLVLFKTKWRP